MSPHTVEWLGYAACAAELQAGMMRHIIPGLSSRTWGVMRQDCKCGLGVSIQEHGQHIQTGQPHPIVERQGPQTQKPLPEKVS
jgi:hypothetical protein